MQCVSSLDAEVSIKMKKANKAQKKEKKPELYAFFLYKFMQHGKMKISVYYTCLKNNHLSFNQYEYANYPHFFVATGKPGRRNDSVGLFFNFDKKK